MQGKLEKLGAADVAGTDGNDAPVKAKEQAQRELDENLVRAHEEKARIAEEIEAIENELSRTMTAIKTMGLVTLKLENELEQSWDLVKKTQAAAGAVDEITDKREVTQENVNAFMSSIECTVAELLMDTGNHILPQHMAQERSEEPQFDFGRMP